MDDQQQLMETLSPEQIALNLEAGEVDARQMTIAASIPCQLQPEIRASGVARVRHRTFAAIMEAEWLNAMR